MPRVLRGYHPLVGSLAIDIYRPIDRYEADHDAPPDPDDDPTITIGYYTLLDWFDRLTEIADHFELFRPEEQVETGLDPAV